MNLAVGRKDVQGPAQLPGERIVSVEAEMHRIPFRMFLLPRGFLFRKELSLR
jgi:hypothetical protein